MLQGLQNQSDIFLLPSCHPEINFYCSEFQLLVNFKKLNFNDYLLYRQLKNHSPDLGDSVVFDLKKQFSQQNTAQHKKLCTSFGSQHNQVEFSLASDSVHLMHTTFLKSLGHLTISRSIISSLYPVLR